MNERIANFANQAGFDVDITGRFGNYSEMTRVEKFSELIVKECASIASNAEYNDTWSEPVEDTIKKHFEVEQ